MSDREALTAALAALDEQARIEWVLTDHFAEVEQAARERLAQLPVWWCVQHDRIANVEFGGFRHCEISTRPMQANEPDCRASKVYPAELVERIKALGFVVTTERAALVLDALNDQPRTVRTTTDGTSRV